MDFKNQIRTPKLCHWYLADVTVVYVISLIKKLVYYTLYTILKHTLCVLCDNINNCFIECYYIKLSVIILCQVVNK